MVWAGGLRQLVETFFHIPARLSTRFFQSADTEAAWDPKPDARVSRSGASGGAAACRMTAARENFLTDFGLRDGYVGVLKGVVLGIAPMAQLIDITHDIPPQDIAAGAWLLGTSYRYFPLETV